MEDTTKTKTFEDNFDTFSGFTEGIIDITSPMKFNAKMELRNLTLIAGMNDTGKSLFNKINWCLTFFFNIKLTEKYHKIQEEMPSEELIKLIFDHSFSDQNFNGTMTMNYRDSLLKVKLYGVSVVMKDGEVQDLTFDIGENTEPMGQVTYLSTEVRNFSNISKYVKIKKMMGIDELQTFKDIVTLSEFYKIYDVMAIEYLLTKFDDANSLLKLMGTMSEQKELLQEFDISELMYDKPTATMAYKTAQCNIRNITTLGAGAQSILIMLMTAQ